MAEKSRGLRFAEQQLRRHGWEHGKGLGRAENGISEAIKVKVKCDKGGVGHKEGEQFSFHWWDHVFNKASSSLQVESDQDGIKVKKTAEEEDGMVSNKKPRKATLAKDKLYGCFVKSATLLSGQERPEPTASSSSSSDEDDDRRMDLSSTTRLSDSDLMKACGGRTAHKGARHGVTMSAKLARLERQEAEFMAKYGKKSRAADASAVCASTPPTSQPQEELMENRLKVNDGSGAEVSETAAQPKRRKKKKKKKKKGDDAEDRSDVDLVPAEHCEPGGSHRHKKHKKKNKVRETLSAGGAAELHADPVKKKKPKRPIDEHHSDSKESSQSNHAGLEEAESVVRKRKKCKKDKICADEEAAPERKKSL